MSRTRRRADGAGRGWLARGWVRVVSTPQVPAAAVIPVTLAAAAAAAGIALLDRSTEVNLAILYIIPPVVVTVLVNRDAGLALAAETAGVWAAARWSQVEGPGAMFVDAAVRFLVVGFVVLIISQLRAALMQAHRSDQRSREFLALAAHQLRTPMAGISASCEALIGLDSAPSQEQLLANIAMESQRAGKLVSSLLALSRADSDHPLAITPVDLGEVCRDAVQRARGLAPHLAVRLEGGGAGGLANPEAVRHIVSNLLENALRHARSTVTFTVGRTDGAARVTVTDDGPGVPLGSEEAVFERFVSLDGSGGSGLGLALSRSLARRLGGDLSYDWGVFSLTLPAATLLTTGDDGEAARRV